MTMKSYLVLLLSFITAFTVYGNNEEAKNEEEVNTLQEILTEEENANRGMYFSVSLSPIISAPNAKFAVESKGGSVRSGEIPINAQVYTNADMALGRTFDLDSKRGIRYQGGFKWMSFTLGGPHYQRFDFAPVDVATINEHALIDGDITAIGPVGGLFYDHNIGSENNKDFDEWVYVGTSFGLLKTDLSYGLDILNFSTTGTGSDWIRMNQIEFGAVWELTDKIDLQVGYEWMHLGGMGFGNVDGNESLLSTESLNRHMVKVGVLHFWNRK